MSGLTDEEYEQVIRQVPVRTVTKPAEKTIDQILQDENERKRQHKIEARNALLFAQQQRLNEIAEEQKIFNVTQNKHLLLKKGLEGTQCLWTDDVCEFCKKGVKRLQENWAGWFVGKPGSPQRGVLYDDSTIDSSLNYTVPHQCEINQEVLSRQITFLTNELRKLKTDIPEQIRQAIYLNTLGR